jgi:hypothetical protein
MCIPMTLETYESVTSRVPVSQITGLDGNVAYRREVGKVTAADKL